MFQTLSALKLSRADCVTLDLYLTAELFPVLLPVSGTSHLYSANSGSSNFVTSVECFFGYIGLYNDLIVGLYLDSNNFVVEVIAVKSEPTKPEGIFVKTPCWQSIIAY